MDSGESRETTGVAPELTVGLIAGGVYVDLLQNPERFTGYAGPSSSRVWKAIYEENCFTPVPFIDPSRAVSEGGTGFASLSSVGMGLGGLSGGAWGESERRLVGNLVGPRDGGEEVCLEKRVFYRLISGMSYPPSSPCILAYMYESRPACIHFHSYLRRVSRSNDGRMGESSPPSFSRLDPTSVSAVTQPSVLHHTHRPAP